MTSKERTQSKRIQTSILNAGEKKLLVWIAKRLPRWVTSDMLTGFGILGAMVVALGYALSSIDILYLWIANLGLFMNWFGDSLDGSLARVRNTQRPVYGFFIDHNMDGVTITIMCIGAGLCPLIHMYTCVAVLIVYLLLSIYVYITAHLKNEFKLTYGHLGPTEFRVIVFIINILFMYIAPLRRHSWELQIFGLNFTITVFDCLLVVFFVVLLVMYLTSVIHDAKQYAKEDPLPEMKD